MTLEWSMLKLLCGGALLLACFALPAPLRAQDELTRAKGQLTRQVQLVEIVEQDTERQDLDRLMLLKQTSTRVLGFVEARGLGHAETFREYQVLVLAYKFNEQFLGSIRTDVTTAAIDELLQTAATIAEERGLEDPPYTKITWSVFDQLWRNFQALKGQPVPEDLKATIDTLAVDFGNVLARAQHGDTLPTMEAAKALYYRIVELYPALDDIAGSSAGFELGLTIRGLAEFYREYSKLDQT